MRNLLHRSAVVVVALLMAAPLLVGDLFAAPAEAQSAYRRPSSNRARLAQRRRARTSRSAGRFRPVALPAGDVWARLRHCESSGRYDINTGNGFFGAYQFLPRTWWGLGYPGMPHEAPPDVQDEAARKLQARSGWGQWPACSRRIGVR